MNVIRQRRLVTVRFLACVLLFGCVKNPALAQTPTVLHNFTGGSDGATPYGGLTSDRAGNLYGTASAGGYTGNNCTPTGCGTAFRLTHRGASWTFAPLYSFQGNEDGSTPYAGVTIAVNGTLYGTTILGASQAAGTIFRLQPGPHTGGNVLAPWTETQLYQFTCGADGCFPAYGSLVVDSSGNLYGTTYQGGAACNDGSCGTVFKLTSSGLMAYEFPGREAGGNPLSGVVLDSAGNLYGTTSDNNYAPVVYQLTPAGPGWSESVLFTFPFSQNAQGGVILDATGDLVGTTLGVEVENLGNAAYRLSPSDGQWRYSLLYNFGGPAGTGPFSGVVQGQDGSFYGTTCARGAHGNGSVFKLTRTQSGWTETDLYDFAGGSDGACPVGGIALDTDGDIYGTTAYGGTGYGVVWEITP